MSVECPHCDREFDSNKALGMHCHHSHDGRPWMPEDKIREMYHKRGMSQRDIASEFGCSQRPVQKAMEWYGIESEKSCSDPTRPPNHKFDRMKEPVGTEYEVIQTTIDYEPVKFYIHRLLAVAVGELEPHEFYDPDKVVHHKSEHGLDNRPENIKGMDRGDHQTMHLEERYG